MAAPFHILTQRWAVVFIFNGLKFTPDCAQYYSYTSNRIYMGQPENLINIPFPAIVLSS